MKTTFTLIFAIFISGILFAQVSPNKYWVKFTDKDNSPYSINNPEEFLSEKAIQRRAKFEIPLTTSDLPVNPAYIQSVTDLGVTLLNTSKWFNSITIYTTDPSKIAQIEALPHVVSVDKSSGNKLKSGDKFEKPFFANETISGIPETGSLKKTTAGKSYDYGEGYNQIEMLNGIALHDLGYDGAGMTIAVLDAGFLNADDISAFDNLWSNGQILGYKDFVNPTNPNLFGSHSHGTMVLSTMGAYLPGQLVGTAPMADYWLLRSEDGDSETLIEELNWVSAAEFADSVGADIINSSLGYTEFDDPSQNHTYSDMDGNTTPITIGADMAVSKGMIVVNSAGNSGGDPWQYIGAPADGDSVFSIGAVTGSGNYANFSSTGPTADGRFKPNVVAQGQGSALIEPWGGSVSNGSGTSFSSPITAGMVACLWQANPNARNTEIMEAIQESATLANNPNNQLGYGIPDYLEAHLMLPTSIDSETITQRQIVVSPNPFRNEIKLSAGREHEKILSITISDISGRIVYSRKYDTILKANTHIKMNGFSNLREGIYFLTIKTGNGTVSKKLLKK
ncbi:MAG: S8 family serine peptidase [Bacteroidales bacterium]|nr:S8 family serine peptidase [Bacteroidales bacterium]